ncbi:hypothetical protein HS088_TW12G00196 [Tripterygium wilfordii]|uniref:Uncharacterized protein n=1 Tax=Tripterygium wilfordii TaxID=458696 RepID=A0A7J7CY59_TRIWF|nr:hypothetical protein HS088_TW12G00196 [Tripterygium wilfordii]
MARSNENNPAVIRPKDLQFRDNLLLSNLLAPLQKAGIVDLIKSHTKDMTLAIGDGHHEGMKNFVFAYFESLMEYWTAWREISPTTKDARKKLSAEDSKKCSNSSSLNKSAPRDPKRGLFSWIEAESLCHLSANIVLWCFLLSPTLQQPLIQMGERLLHSKLTHLGDHTVKIYRVSDMGLIRLLPSAEVRKGSLGSSSMMEFMVQVTLSQVTFLRKMWLRASLFGMVMGRY